jgi:hypothetical protein
VHSPAVDAPRILGLHACGLHISRVLVEGTSAQFQQLAPPSGHTRVRSIQQIYATSGGGSADCASERVYNEYVRALLDEEEPDLLIHLPEVLQEAGASHEPVPGGPSDGPGGVGSEGGGAKSTEKGGRITEKGDKQAVGEMGGVVVGDSAEKAKPDAVGNAEGTEPEKAVIGAVSDLMGDKEKEVVATGAEGASGVVVQEGGVTEVKSGEAPATGNGTPDLEKRLGDKSAAEEKDKKGGGASKKTSMKVEDSESKEPAASEKVGDLDTRPCTNLEGRGSDPEWQAAGFFNPSNVMGSCFILGGLRYWVCSHETFCRRKLQLDYQAYGSLNIIFLPVSS